MAKSYGHRLTVITGAIVTSIGLALSSFANSYMHLIITFGVITGMNIHSGYTSISSIPILVCSPTLSNSGAMAQ